MEDMECGEDTEGRWVSIILAIRASLVCFTSFYIVILLFCASIVHSP